MEHIFLFENKDCDQTSQQRNKGWKPDLSDRKSIDIHAIEREDDVWDRHNDRNDRQDFHDDI